MHPTLKTLALTALCLSVSGCALLPKSHHWVKIQPFQTPDAGDRSDGYYASARTAIDRRDYGRALDYLQAARQRNPNDVRVLNAMAVVYDKLGRFDLSARYYAQAEEVEPASPIVLHNLAYSAELRALTVSPRPTLLEPATPVVASAPAPAPVLAQAPAPQPTFDAPRLVAAGGNVLRLELPVETAAVAPKANELVTGYPLAVVDATGRDGVAERVRVELNNRGWTAPASAASTASAADRSEIRYTEQQTKVATALARTLPVAPKMVLCTEACKGVRLIVGRDAAGWSFSKPAIVIRNG